MPHTFVLVHGAWHGGWCWKHVTPRLRAAGHTVFVPTLTGFGEKVHLANPSIDCSTHATDIENLIVFEELENVILVGHSYAGLVISRVADRMKPRLRHMVYLDAMIPEARAKAKDGAGLATVVGFAVAAALSLLTE